MLTEKRQEEIIKLIESKGSVTVQELTEYFQTSESTIRRDLNVLDKKGALVKVFGGAVQSDRKLTTREDKVSLRMELHREEKLRIGRHAAALIAPEDFVYLDAGTTTGAMIPYLSERSASFVTNAVSHALQLAENGFRVILIGGELKSSTEAIVGNEAFVTLQKYHFTKGFFGANGISRHTGFTTPDINEAMIKECAMKHTRQAYVLCDHSKFHQTTPVCFGEFSCAQVITDRLPDESYQGIDNLTVVSKF
ncbi:MAG: DeoR/GlpR transcriptional regulator [Lachnospiraceae bacterium]|nr:DeoR/GlpR transcriptional regulator [Lachnospiraceae bacterium]